MRKFYEVMSNSDLADYMYIESYDLKNFDYQLIFSAKRCFQSELSDIKLYVQDSNLKSIDFMTGPLSWPIISDRFLDLVLDEIKRDVEILEPPLFSLSTCEKMDGYNLINILTEVDCIDPKRAVKGKGADGRDLIYEIYVRADMIPDNVNIFRIPGCLGDIIVSEDFLYKIRGAGLTGIVMSEVS